MFTGKGFADFGTSGGRSIFGIFLQHSFLAVF